MRFNEGKKKRLRLCMRREKATHAYVKRVRIESMSH